MIREAADQFYLVSAGAFQRLDHDWLKKHMPADGSVQFQNLTNSIGVLAIAGPKARELMSRVTDADLSNEAFPWLMSHNIVVDMTPVRAARVNFVGELGWELHHPIEMQNHIFDLLMDAGGAFDLKPFGIRAMDSLRYEKSYRMWGTELSIEYAALESGLHRFVQASFDRLGPVKEARAEMSALRQRLDQLEKTLANLEEGRAKKPAGPRDEQTASPEEEA